MKLVPQVDIVDALPELAHSRFALPFTQRGQRYYADAYDNAAQDHSFGFADEAGWCALVPCNTARAGMLTWYEFPIEIWVRAGLPTAQMRKLARDVLGTLRQRAHAAGVAEVLLREASDPAFNGILSALLLEKGVMAAPSFGVMIDLSLPDDQLFAAMRSGHRQQVRAGERILALTHVDAANPDPVLFDQYRQLHAEVAGRVTRPRASWDRMFDLVAAGEGHLILSHFEGQLLGGTLMLDADRTSYYSSGAYVRSQTDKPLAHYPLFTAFQRARQRGCTHVHVGEVIPPRLTETAKELTINSFKLGFSATVWPSRIWTIAAAR
jgi:hypothetical protein